MLVFVLVFMGMVMSTILLKKKKNIEKNKKILGLCSTKNCKRKTKLTPHNDLHYCVQVCVHGRSQPFPDCHPLTSRGCDDVHDHECIFHARGSVRGGHHHCTQL